MVNASHVINFFSLMVKHDVQYVLIKNDCGLIPYNIEDEKDIDILVHPKEYHRFLELMQNSGYARLNGESRKYYFAYKLRPDLYMCKDDVYIHAYDRLACNSFTNMGRCKLPLHRRIQEDIWKNKIWDAEFNWWIMDDTSILLYLIIRCILDKSKFKDIYKIEIEKRRFLFENMDFLSKLHLVFFNFSPTLVKMLNEKNYDNIIPAYYSFKNY